MQEQGFALQPLLQSEPRAASMYPRTMFQAVEEKPAIAIPQAAAATSNHPLSLVGARDFFRRVTADSLLWFSGSAMYGVPLRSPPDESDCNIWTGRERFAAGRDG